MKSILIRTFVISTLAGLTACSNMTNPFSSQPAPQRYGTTQQTTTVSTRTTTGYASDGTAAVAPKGNQAALAGNLGRSMDSMDRSKLSRALDGPTGKATRWTNANSGVSYTVTPVKKVVINGNPYCRQYHVTAQRNENMSNLNGTACVGQDGKWEVVG